MSLLFAVQYFPKTEKYVALFRHDGDEEHAKVERERLRALVKVSQCRVTYTFHMYDICATHAQQVGLDSWYTLICRTFLYEACRRHVLQVNIAQGAMLAEEDEGGLADLPDDDAHDLQVCICQRTVFFMCRCKHGWLSARACPVHRATISSWQMAAVTTAGLMAAEATGRREGRACRPSSRWARRRRWRKTRARPRERAAATAATVEGSTAGAAAAGAGVMSAVTGLQAATRAGALLTSGSGTEMMAADGAHSISRRISAAAAGSLATVTTSGEGKALGDVAGRRLAGA